MAEYNNPFLGRDNPYLTAKIDQAQGDLRRNFDLTTQPAYNSAMVRSGCAWRHPACKALSDCWRWS